MSFTRLCFFVVSISVLIWGLYLLLQPSGFAPVVAESTSEGLHTDKIVAAKDGQNDQLFEEIRDLRKVVTLLKSRVMSLETQLQVRRAVQPSAVPATNQATEQPGLVSEDELDEAALAEQEQASWEEYMNLVETGLQYEQTDVQWSSKAKAEIENAFTTQELAGASVTDIECRSTLCRIEVAHVDRQPLAEFEILLPKTLAHILPQALMERVELEDGSTSTLIYLARDGYDLPEPDNLTKETW